EVARQNVNSIVKANDKTAIPDGQTRIAVAVRWQPIIKHLSSRGELEHEQSVWISQNIGAVFINHDGRHRTEKVWFVVGPQRLERICFINLECENWSASFGACRSDCLNR